jgi:hypothetical protein
MHNCAASTDNMRSSFDAKKEKRRKKAVYFWFNPDLRYLFNDAFFDVFSPQHFGHVNSKK